MPREILLNILHEAQNKHGYLSEDVLKELSVSHNIPISQLYSVATFYTMFRTKPQGKYVIHICGSPSCVLNNATTLANFLQKELKIKIGETTKDNLFSLYKTSCIGCCNEAPAMLINAQPYTKLTEKSIREILNNLKSSKNKVSKSANSKLKKSAGKKTKSGTSASKKSKPKKPANKKIKSKAKKLFAKNKHRGK
ncbi:MAG: NAD(P)H-dependent oxidoreductase subunit E [Candidatus Micrarchaeia archaeon]